MNHIYLFAFSRSVSAPSVHYVRMSVTLSLIISDSPAFTCSLALPDRRESAREVGRAAVSLITAVSHPGRQFWVA